MRGHEAMKDQLFALYDGELTGATRRTVEAHLAGCSACRHTYTQWQHTASTFFPASQIQVPDAFVRRLMERLDVLERPRRAPPWMVAIRWLVPAVGFAGVMLVAMASSPHPFSIENLLLAGGRETVSAQLVLASEPPTTEEVLGVLMEGQP